MLRPYVLSGVLVGLVAVAGGGGAGASAPRETPVTASSQPGLSLTVSPSTGGKHDRFTVAITSRHATGVFGKWRRTYTAEAHAVRPASGCVNNRDRAFPDRPAGTRVRAKLDPARGEGGPEGWCLGLFRGTVTFSEAFACPPAGCHPVPGVATRGGIVARFSFRVR
jgi:hypothetical protein